MKRFRYLGMLSVLIGVGVLSGCGGTVTSAASHSGSKTISSTPEGQSAVPSPTPVSLSVELGTRLAGSGQTISIVNPKTRFTASDTFAFVIHLRSPIDVEKIACLIFDSEENIAWEWYVNTPPSSTVLASATPALGSVLEKYTSSAMPDGTTIPAPLGIYVLQVFPYPSSPLNYANNVTFTYDG
jgi:hypothetical protein